MKKMDNSNHVHSKQPEKENLYLKSLFLENKTFQEAVNSFLKTTSTYTKNARKHVFSMQTKKIMKGKFSCDGCGKCCDSILSSFVLPCDIKNWWENEMGMILVSISNYTIRDSIERPLLAMVLDRKSDYNRKLKYKSQMYKDSILALNPSLSLISKEEEQQCVFYNSLSKQCSIHDNKPEMCKTFPYIVGKTKMKCKHDVVTIMAISRDESICNKETIDECKVDDVLAIPMLELRSVMDGNEMFLKSKLDNSSQHIKTLYSFLVQAFMVSTPEMIDFKKIDDELKEAKMESLKQQELVQKQDGRDQSVEST